MRAGTSARMDAAKKANLEAGKKRVRRSQRAQCVRTLTAAAAFGDTCTSWRSSGVARLTWLPRWLCRAT